MTLSSLPSPNFSGADLSARLNAGLAELRAARRLATIAALLADTTLAYGSGPRPVAEGDIIEAGGYRYQVAASGASDHHASTAGGVRLYALAGPDGAVNVDALGAAGDGSDDSAFIQKAVDAFPKVRFSAKTYGIGAPIQFGSRTTLDGIAPGEGTGRGRTVLKKIGTTAGVGSAASPSGGGITDSFAVNAVLIASHAGGFNYSCAVRDIQIEGADDFTTSCGIYAPRIAQWVVENVHIKRCQTGWLTYDGWQCSLTRLTVNGETVAAALATAKSASTEGFAATTRGVHWAKDGSGRGTGTSNTFMSCWARRCHIGWDINNLAYSSLICSAADDISQTPYRFESCHNMTLTGCGMEQAVLSPGMLFSAGTYNIIGFRGEAGMYGASGQGFYDARTGATVTFLTSVLASFDAANGALNRVIQDGAQVIEIGTTTPANGSSFVGYGGGATRASVSAGVTSISDATGTSRMGRSGLTLPALAAEPTAPTGVNLAISDGTASTNGFGDGGAGLYVKTGSAWAKV